MSIDNGLGLGGERPEKLVPVSVVDMQSEVCYFQESKVAIVYCADVSTPIRRDVRARLEVMAVGDEVVSLFCALVFASM